MKKILLLAFTIFITTACQRNGSAPDQGSAPNTSTEKDGRGAGSGTSGSLGNTNQ
jgi:hypothetical protein